MDIEAYVKKKCSHVFEENEHEIHDRTFDYAQALRRIYNYYNGMSLCRLKFCQEIARNQFKYDSIKNSSHRIVATCEIIYELIKERNADNKEFKDNEF